MKKTIAILLLLAMLLSMAACGAKPEAPAEPTAEADAYVPSQLPVAEPTGITITLLNTRAELQSQFESMARRYLRSTGVAVEVTSISGTSLDTLEARYESGTPYTLTMADPKTIYTLGPEHGVDMSAEPWVQNTNYALEINDSVYGFPFCVEACGILYNGDAIYNLTGKPFDPASVSSLSAFEELLKQLASNGMKRPVGIQQEADSLTGNYLMQVYAMQLDPNLFVDSLYAGKADLSTNMKLNNLLDTFDVLKDYNYAYKSPLTADRKAMLERLGEGEIAFCFGGNWDWSYINASDYTDNIGIMPVPQNTTDDANRRLVGGATSYFLVDNSYDTSDEERQAALDFLNWLAFDVEGNAFITDSCALIPAFTNITSGYLDPLGTIVKSYMDKGMMIDSYYLFPSDHTEIMGLNMQVYLDSQIDRSEFLNYLRSYWTKATPVPKA